VATSIKDSTTLGQRIDGARTKLHTPPALTAEEITLDGAQLDDEIRRRYAALAHDQRDAQARWRLRFCHHAIPCVLITPTMTPANPNIALTYGDVSGMGSWCDRSLRRRAQSTSGAMT
jgi:hypothetical protein